MQPEDPNVLFAEFIHSLARINRTLNFFSLKVRRMQDVNEVMVDFNCFGPDAPTIEGSTVGFAWEVEADLTNGISIVWAVDITWDGTAWCVSRDFVIDGKDGPEPIERYKAKVTLSLRESIVLLEETVQEMIATAELRPPPSLA